MKFTLAWLKEHLETDKSLEEIVQKLSMIGLEVENVVDRSEPLAEFCVGEIVSAEKHPNADRLKVCMINCGGEVSRYACHKTNFDLLFLFDFFLNKEFTLI